MAWIDTSEDIKLRIYTSEDIKLSIVCMHLFCVKMGKKECI